MCSSSSWVLVEPYEKFQFMAVSNQMIPLVDTEPLGISCAGCNPWVFHYGLRFWMQALNSYSHVVLVTRKWSHAETWYYKLSQNFVCFRSEMLVSIDDYLLCNYENEVNFNVKCYWFFEFCRNKISRMTMKLERFLGYHKDEKSVWNQDIFLELCNLLLSSLHHPVEFTWDRNMSN